jgi:putative protease
MKRVELLSPAGNYETMVGAFNAGADAVYLGGSKFGARAYADNFDRDQVLDAISYAHLHNKRIYMTVNTLVKEREFDQLYDFLLPFAEKRLDGVIVQDYGVMRFIREEFPEVELHASTQQMVTGIYGAKLLKELGCCRVVPARELSLYEMKNIREKADIEVEAFIHGAMCYCYSGACLFSSMVGSRSGNRGRCAQPCRLPYMDRNSEGKEIYPLSLKDMCTIDIISELIKAGIDSFKIEGRMKKPEFSAGVTSLYRKYINEYYANPGKPLKVSKEDRKMLSELYLRTEISEGYYHKHNGREMLTISSPAYNGTSDQVIARVRNDFLGSELKVKCQLDGYFTVGQPAILNMSVVTPDETIVESVTGNEVQSASKRPMDEESITKQLSKLGNTHFEAEAINVVIDDNGTNTGIFVPVGELNEMRRLLCEKMEGRLLGTDNKPVIRDNPESNGNKDGSKAEKREADYSILVVNKGQLDAVLQECRGRNYILYIDSDIYFTLDKAMEEKLTKAHSDGVEILVALPYVSREEEKFDGTRDIDEIMKDSKGILDGILVRNLEQLGYLKEKNYEGKIITDYGVYVWNNEAAQLLGEINGITELTVPLELTFHEVRDLSIDKALSFNVYGRTPMMITANCIKKTLGSCSGKQWQFNQERLSMVDRMGNNLPITTNCRNCYNVIWNAHPTSLHKKLDNIRDTGKFDHFRLDFSTESEAEVKTVIGAFVYGEADALKRLDEMNYTTGHFKRGVE